MPTVIGTNGMDMMEIYIDASYANHQDLKGHTGGVLTLGRGIVQGKASKQKLSIKSLA